MRRSTSRLEARPPILGDGRQMGFRPTRALFMSISADMPAALAIGRAARGAVPVSFEAPSRHFGMPSLGACRESATSPSALKGKMGFNRPIRAIVSGHDAPPFFGSAARQSDPWCLLGSGLPRGPNRPAGQAKSADH